MSNLIKTKFGKANINNKGYYDIVSVNEGNFKKKLHRLIYEDYHGVTLLPTTDVHHIDGNKLNNNIENLEAISHSEHSKRHMNGSDNPMHNKTHRQESMFKMSANKSTTGFFRVSKVMDKQIVQGFSWGYQYFDDNNKRKQISRKNLYDLKKVVVSKNLIWKVLDESNAKLICEEFGYVFEELT